MRSCIYILQHHYEYDSSEFQNYFLHYVRRNKKNQIESYKQQQRHLL